MASHCLLLLQQLLAMRLGGGHAHNQFPCTGVLHNSAFSTNIRNHMTMKLLVGK